MDWFRVKAAYPDDIAIQKVGERGEVLFMRGLAYCALADTEGFIPETQLPRFGLRQISIRVAALVMVGLWDTVDGGYQIRNWDVHQSPEYAAERKRLRDAARARARRAQEAAGQTVARQSYDNRATVAGTEEEEELNPPTPAQRGGSCDGQHDNCRRCGTTRRALAKAAATWKPRWCGVCDERTRLIDYDTDMPTRCLDCHPLSETGDGNVA